VKEIPVRTNTIQIRLTIVFVSIGIIAASLLLTAQAPVLVARYTATTSNVSGAGDAIRIELLKWSTDADRDQLLNAWLHPAPPPPPVVAQAAPPAAGGGGRGGGGRGGGGDGTFKCYNCGEPGHMSRNCPQKQQNPGQGKKKFKWFLS